MSGVDAVKKPFGKACAPLCFFSVIRLCDADSRQRHEDHTKQSQNNALDCECPAFADQSIYSEKYYRKSKSLFGFAKVALAPNKKQGENRSHKSPIANEDASDYQNKNISKSFFRGVGNFFIYKADEKTQKQGKEHVKSRKRNNFMTSECHAEGDFGQKRENEQPQGVLRFGAGIRISFDQKVAHGDRRKVPDCY